ncbi:MAG: hypothetical protein ACOX4L_09275 [Bacillota bacterium]|jgi:uncharacterized protein YoxC
MYISLKDLGLIIIFLTVLAAVVYFIFTLKNFNDILKYAKEFLKRHNDSIDESVALVPETIKNANKMTVSIKEQVDQVGVTFNSLGNGLSETVATINETTDTSVTVIRSLGEIVKVLIDVFSSTKEK